MGTPGTPDLVNLVALIFAANIDYWFDRVKNRLEEVFGPMDYVSEELDFEKYTLYYNQEMGVGIKARLVSFERLVHPYALADIKLITNAIEDDFRVDGKRRVNIDPGYVHHAQFVLATTKYWANRVYLRRGIYADVTLTYVRGRFVPGPSTYPNYRDEVYINEIQKIREMYLRKRKKLRSKGSIEE
ncbi:MAG TPA: DUF4416 domain-containing protein [Thermotogae bacterium]|nr:DUF4416 domain-containing protein [Thermotogota bacterium]